MRMKFGYRIFLIVAIVGALAGMVLVDPRFAAISGLVIALWLFARSAIALLK